MKYFLIFILFCLFAIITNGQTLLGQYDYYKERLQFRNDTLNFDIQSNGGLTFGLKGQGQFHRIEEYLVVTTGNYPGQRSSYQKDCSKPFKLEIVDGDAYALSIVYFDKNGTPNNKVSAETEKIEVLCFGCDHLVIPYSKCHFLVTLYYGHVLENTNVVFKIHSQTDKQVELELITTNFDSDALSIRKLRKTEKKLKRKYGDDNNIKTFTKS